MRVAVVGLPDFPLGKKGLIDQRLKALEETIRPSKTTLIAIEFLDYGGLKDADYIICEKESRLDLIIDDLEAVENRLARLKEAEEGGPFARAKEILEKNLLLCEENFSEEEKKALFNSNLASLRPAYIVDKNKNRPIQEIIFDGYYSWGLICFFTGVKDKELRAWPIKKGTTAFQAAGAVHTDIQRGFIKAEVIGYQDLIKSGGLNQARQFMHLEGRDYIVQDADVLNFKFNV